MYAAAAEQTVGREKTQISIIFWSFHFAAFTSFFSYYLTVIGVQCQTVKMGIFRDKGKQLNQEGEILRHKGFSTEMAL